jgi:hypothetical protein
VPTVFVPPFPVSEAFAVAVAVIVYELAFTRDVTWYSWFSTVAVIAPPRLTAPENVTKSPNTQPWAVSATVIVALPFVAANVTSPALVTKRIGVMSFGSEPSTT